MRVLYLLRHAKSSWKDTSLADFERPLTGRGRKACLRIAEFIKVNQLSFDLMVSSTAIRARETAELIKDHARLRVELRYDERIYEASPARLLEVVSQFDKDRKSVLLVGHNPGLEDFLQQLTGEQQHLSTANLAKIKLTISKWSQVGENKGALEWLVRPKELDQT